MKVAWELYVCERRSGQVGVRAFPLERAIDINCIFVFLCKSKMCTLSL
ncbi:protein of unknown function [Vibrio tapetis subsp. tapetis]|uniref:Uncharacterized protein n=1 Tax=Vibrio tapetis subsp. tapetis TaxID=1671868 RepID=A0A2N8ZAR5_9VIBR|nr:protein of unknown function [Vibrio tapetis subsp. tapetis]